MSEGKLQKLKITAYSSSKFRQKDKISDGEFTTLINPETYSLNYKIEYNEEQSSGTSAVNPKFEKSTPPDLEIQVVFDGTGVVQIPQGNDFVNPEFDLIDEIQRYKQLLFSYNGEDHKPNHVMIQWGSLLFKAVLVDLSFEYKLFKPDGSPLRVIAKTTFRGSVEENLRAAMENNQSPDLTHARSVVEGDTLPALSEKIYGDPKYYLEVARVNNLTNFRKLTPGTELFFPPIEKQS